MADPFSEAITALVERSPGITGAVFADLDGSDVAVHPRASREMLRLCAAYGGIALRRLDGAEAAAGRGPVRRLLLQGTAGSFVALKVGKEYQLVLAVKGGWPPGQVTWAAAEAVTTLEENM